MAPYVDRSTMKIRPEITATYLSLPCTYRIFMLLDACTTLNNSFTFSFAFEAMHDHGMI